MSSIRIKELAQEDIDEAAWLYAQGILMEIPPGSTASVDELAEMLGEDLEIYLEERGTRTIWLAIQGAVMKGLVDFFLESPRVRIKFVCAIPPSQGTGTLLLRQLAQHSVSHNVTTITAEVSKDDARAWNFYFNHLGFQNHGIISEEPGLTLHLATVPPHTLLDHQIKEW